MRTPTLGDNTLDSRDIIERIEELEGEREALVDALVEGEPTDVDAAKEAIEDWDNENAKELANWKELADQCEGYGDWAYGETLIHDSYWVEYCEELCKDIGTLPQEIPDYIVIDWDATAENLKVDYMEVEAGDETYYMRNC